MTTIITKNSSTASAVPLAADLVQGELAVNVTSKALYTKNASAAVVKLNTPSIVDNGDATAITIDSSENVGIGTSSPAAKLHVSSPNVASRGQLTIEGSDTVQSTWYKGVDIQAQAFGDGTQFVFGTSQGIPLILRTNSTERARIDSSGLFLYNTTTAAGGASTFKSTSAAGQCLSLWNSATSGTRYFLSFATEATSTDRGYITYNGTSVAISQASDVRLKENIIDAPSALPKIAEMQIRSFDFKEDGRHVEFGVIAQELHQVLPSAVFEGADNEDGTFDKPWSVGLEPVIPVLVKAIQEQQALINAQQAALTTLTERITALEAK